MRKEKLFSIRLLSGPCPNGIKISRTAFAVDTEPYSLCIRGRLEQSETILMNSTMQASGIVSGICCRIGNRFPARFLFPDRFRGCRAIRKHFRFVQPFPGIASGVGFS